MELILWGESRLSSKEPWTRSFEVNFGIFPGTTIVEEGTDMEEERLNTLSVAQGFALLPCPVLTWYSKGCNAATCCESVL